MFQCMRVRIELVLKFASVLDSAEILPPLRSHTIVQHAPKYTKIASENMYTYLWAAVPRSTKKLHFHKNKVFPSKKKRHGSQPPFKIWWFLLDDDKPLLLKNGVS